MGYRLTVQAVIVKTPGEHLDPAGTLFAQGFLSRSFASEDDANAAWRKVIDLLGDDAQTPSAE